MGQAAASTAHGVLEREVPPPRRRPAQRARCKRCGGRKWYREGTSRRVCVKCNDGYYKENTGLHRIAAISPGLADRIRRLRELPLSRQLLQRAARHSRWERCFFPSVYFPGIGPRLDGRLVLLGRNTDVDLCESLAAVQSDDQREFLDLYLQDPADAKHWAELPAWKRPIRRGDEQDRLIWRVFTVVRLNMEFAAKEGPRRWGIKSQGLQLRSLGGLLSSIKATDRLGRVLSLYGQTIWDGLDSGNPKTPPWQGLPGEP